MSNNLSLPVPRSVAIGGAGSTTKASSTFSSAYVYATSGACLGVRFIAPVTQNLTDVWFYVNTVTGTPGNTTCELRDFLAGNQLKPGTNLLASQIMSPGTTAGKWINAHFSSPYGVTRGVTYWVVLGDAAGSVGNNVAVINRGAVLAADVALQARCAAFVSSDGFTTNGAITASPAPIVLKFADGTLLGSPFTTTGNPSSNTLERGLKLSGLTEQITINSVVFAATASYFSGLKIYKGTTAPGGATELTVTFGAGESLSGAASFAPFTFAKNTVYRVVFTYGSAGVFPQYYQIEDPATTTDTINCGFGGGTMQYCIDKNDGTWDDSNTDKFPEMLLLLQDQVAIAAGGVMVNPGMGGGMNG